MLVCAFLCANCTRDRGCSVHPVFPAPSHFRGQTKQSSGALCREIAKSYSDQSPGERSDTRDHSHTAPDIASLIRATPAAGYRSTAQTAHLRNPGRRTTSGIAMRLFEMQMIRQQSNYFFIFPPWLKCNDLISTYDRPRDQLESRCRQQRYKPWQGKTWVNFWGR